jgi:hypothetical protein
LELVQAASDPLGWKPASLSGREWDPGASMWLWAKAPEMAHIPIIPNQLSEKLQNYFADSYSFLSISKHDIKIKRPSLIFFFSF